MTEEEKIQYINYMQLKDELEEVSFNGIKLKLDGINTSAHSIASICVFNEENDYMRNYIRNRAGYIAELSFDKLR